MKTAPSPDEPIVQFSPGELKETTFRDVAVRFAFGAGISTVAGIISTVFGARTGGLLLGFPAILPATLTLIEKEESKRRAEGDDVGSALGATALIAFALVAWTLFSRAGAPAALVAASVAWLLVAFSLYLVLRAVALRRAR